jgi:hypothetical protein
MTGRVGLVAVVVVVAASAGVGSLRGERPTLLHADAAPAALTPTAASPETAASSTWYCAGATAIVPSDDPEVQEDRAEVPAQHVVVVSNPSGHPVAGTVTVYGGELAPPAASGDALSSPSAEPPAAAASTTTTTTPTADHAKADPAPARRPFQLAAYSRLSLPLHEVQPTAAATAAVVEADRGGVAVEQQLAGAHGSDVAPCASAAAPAWHFAWGSTERAARELLVLFNPFPSDVVLDGSFTSDDGVREPLRWQGLGVPARSVVAVDVGDDVTRRAELAAVVRAREGELVVSRVEAVAGDAEADANTGAGLSLTVGQPVPRATWTFADGPPDEGTGESIVLANPSDRDAEVEVAVRTSDESGTPAPQPVPFELDVRAGRTESLDLSDQPRLPAGTARTITVWSRNGVPVVAERVLHHPGDPDRRSSVAGELSASGGTVAAATRWISPVVVHGDDGATRFVVANVDPLQPAEVSIEVQGGLAGQTRPPELQGVVVPAGGQVELDLPDEGAVDPADTASVVVEATRPVVVERALLREGRLRALAPAIPVR